MKSRKGFLGINHPFDSSRVVIIPVPWEKTTTYLKGTGKAPGRILAASEQVEFWDEELGAETSQRGIHTRPAITVSGKSTETVLRSTAREVARARRTGKLPVVLGGEHSVSPGAVQGLRDERNISVLYFDAHPDLRDTYLGSRHNHACAARRIWEAFPDLVIVGARTLCEEEAAFLREHPVPVFWAREMNRDRRAGEKIVSLLKPNVYLSIDLDGLDPSIMPAVGTPEPGGIGWYEFLSLVRRVAENRRIIGLDLVEFCPRPGVEHCDVIAARLLYRVIGYVLMRDMK